MTPSSRWGIVRWEVGSQRTETKIGCNLIRWVKIDPVTLTGLRGIEFNSLGQKGWNIIHLVKLDKTVDWDLSVSYVFNRHIRGEMLNAAHTVLSS